MNIKTISIALLAVLAIAALIVVAVSGDDDHMSGNGMDMAFLTDMTTHHEGAIGMATRAETRATHPEVRMMARRIAETQRGEISTMARIGEDMHAMGTHGAAHMGLSDHAMGMDMDLGGRPFDRAFLDAMIAHHKGAIAMARRLLADGAQPGLRAMAEHMISVQGKEIAQMRAWHERWYGS
jgi:uncharacterized protein (DUF305 family)